MSLDTCYFETERMTVGDWSQLVTDEANDGQRNEFLAALMTDAVTRDLPRGWQGPYDSDRVVAWLAERENESTVLFAADRSSHRPVGVVLLSECDTDHGHFGLRLGYMVAEEHWGQGLASELVEGLASWCRANASVQTLVGGVARDNTASARVLQKNGFEHDATNHAGQPNDEVIYTLTVTT